MILPTDPIGQPATGIPGHPPEELARAPVGPWPRLGSVPLSKRWGIRRHRPSAWWFGVLGLWFLAGLPGPAAVGPGLLLTNVASVVRWRSLQPVPPAEFDLRVVCLYADPEWGSIWLADDSGAFWTGAAHCPLWLRSGDRFDLRATHPLDSAEVDWRTARLTRLATARLPPARLLSAAELSQLPTGDTWAELEGILRRVRYTRNHAYLEIVVGALVCEVTVRGIDRTDRFWPEMEVRCRGVLVPADRYAPPDCQWKLFCPEPDAVTVLQPDLAPHFDAPILVASPDSPPLSGSRIRVRGTLVRQEAGRLELADTPFGRCSAESPQRSLVVPGTLVEVVGTLEVQNPAVPRLTGALYRIAAEVHSDTPPVPRSEASSPLRRLGEVRAATGSAVSQPLPVSVSATALVDLTPVGWDVVFVQDDTGAAFVRSGTNVWGLRPGDRVAVEGVTESNEYGSSIKNAQVRRLGPGEMPSPRRVPLGSLLLGAEDASWVEIHGWVRGASLQDNILHLEVCDGTGRLQVCVGVSEMPLGIRDSLVQIRGAAAAQLNESGQLIGAKIFCPSLAEVQIESPAPPAPFAFPTEALRDLRHFVPNASGLRRAKIAGVVTAQSGGRTVFVQSEDRGILIRLWDDTPVAAGTTVEALGIPVWRGSILELRDARLHPIGSSPLPPPQVLRPADDFNPTLFGRRCSLEAALLSVTRMGGQIVFDLEGALPLDACCPDLPANAELLRIPVGSRIRAVGPIEPAADGAGEGLARRLVLASANDVQVLEWGPWWNRRRLYAIGAAGLALLAASFVWVHSLREQVRRRTNELTYELGERRQAENALRSSLHEKEVLLREIHHRVKNNLQIVSSLLSLQARQVDSLATREALADTQGRIRSMALLHEALYRSGNLAALDVREYLQSLVAHLRRSLPASAHRVEITLAVDDVRLDLDRAVACGVIINELATNSLKHGFPDDRTGRIAIRLQTVPNQQILLEVEDNGVGLPSGFDPARADSLGLLLVSDLARQLGGTCVARSGPGARFGIVFPQAVRAERAPAS